MSAPSAPAAQPRRLKAPAVLGDGRAAGALGKGMIGVYLSVLVLLPVAALLAKAGSGGAGAFWREVSGPEAQAAIKLTLVMSAIVVAVNAVFGTLIAWVLVRDEFPGKRTVNALIDLPFALPTIVAGVVLLALYGTNSPLGIDVAFTRASIALALLFVTLPFVVRSVQPVLIEMDRSMEEAAASLGAGPSLEQLLGELPYTQRAAVRARVLDERSYAAIASELRCSEAVVRQRVHRGLRRLRERLEETA